MYNRFFRLFETSFVVSDECFVAFDNDVACFYNVNGELLDTVSLVKCMIMDAITCC